MSCSFGFSFGFTQNFFTTSQDSPLFSFPKNGFNSDHTENGSWQFMCYRKMCTDLSALH